MERMESMEPISALYTTDYPEIHPQERCRSAGSQLGSPVAPSYNEDIMHKGKFIPGSFSATVGIGFTADMAAERAIKREEGERLAREYCVPFMETSAKTGVNVEMAFISVAKELKHRAVRRPKQLSFQIHQYVQAEEEKSGCCF
ncbi:hypothetical protein CRUP_020777 [Coryphaenoides rupestris]|nr:hypothetical protein CRUP_020777 [Coryphaenoides rupestris]